MKETRTKIAEGISDLYGKGFAILLASSTLAICAAFIIAVSGIGLLAKTMLLLPVLAANVLLFFFLRRRSVKVIGATVEREVKGSDDAIFTEDVEEKIGILDEAGKFFSASLKSDDMFRLVSSRIGEIIPHSTCVLFLSTSENKLEATYASGEYSRAITTVSLDCDEGLAGKAFISGEVQLDKHLIEDRKFVKSEILDVFSSGLAVPLIRGVETFGVLVLYAGAGMAFDDRHRILLEAIGSRVAPLLVSSFSFEQNISNSMTDSLTNLPNERAFYLVLENQIAEAQRFQKQRPLTIMTIDVKEFAQFNRMYGHTAGDKLLAFASGIIEDNLRQMDFLCRSMNDEFWVVLPTASDEITRIIIKRIESAFANQTFTLPDGENYHADINIGTATFLRDGETTNQLLQKSLLRKKQSKTNEESTIIMFPKEYVN